MRLGPAERFFRAVADVPHARRVAVGLRLQSEWGERLRDVRARMATLAAACDQVGTSPRLARVVKAALVLGNKLNLGDVRSLARGHRAEAASVCDLPPP